MQPERHSSERGQAIVLIVLAMVVLLGFTAIAVDGSMVYADRRHSQNGSDASSLAGGTRIASGFEGGGISYSDNWVASPPLCYASGNGNTKLKRTVDDGIAAARARALDNGFKTEEVTLTGECNQANVSAPVSGGGTAVIFVDKFVDFTARIDHKTETAFAHFVTGGELINTVTAVTRIRPTQPLAYGYTIVALNPEDGACNTTNNGLAMHGLGGNGENGLIVDGGGMWSNGCMQVTGNANVQLMNADAFYFGTSNNYTLDKIVLTNGVVKKILDDSYKIPTSMYDVAPPDCSGRLFSTSELLAMFEARRTAQEPHPVLPSNLYCVSDELRLNGGDELAFESSTLVLTHGANINGNADFRIQAPLWNSNPGTKAVPGLAIYQAPTNNSLIKINGNSYLRLRGTILAAGADIDIEGDSETTADWLAQIIGWNVKIGGSSATTARWREDKQIHRPATLELLR